MQDRNEPEKCHLDRNPAPSAFQLLTPCYRTQDWAYRKSHLAGTIFCSYAEKENLILWLLMDIFHTVSDRYKQKSLDGTLSVSSLH